MCGIPGIIQVPYDPCESRHNSPRVAAYQIFKRIDVPILDPHNHISIGIVRKDGIGGRTGLPGKTIQIFLAEDTTRREIGHGTQSGLQGIQEIR